MAKQSPEQKETVERVMHEFKHGELKQRGGRKITNPKQAIAIALHEAGATDQESPARNRQNLRNTKAKERRGETAQAEVEGQARAPKKAAGAREPAAKSPGGEKTRAELYEMAKKRDISGRSRMSKGELERALHA